MMGRELEETAVTNFARSRSVAMASFNQQLERPVMMGIGSPQMVAMDHVKSNVVGMGSYSLEKLAMMVILWTVMAVHPYVNSTVATESSTSERSVTMVID